MEEVKGISDDVYEQIKDFKYYFLTNEQWSLIDKLVLNDELKRCYKMYGLCCECKQPKTGYHWCRICNAKRLQRNFKNWTSGNDDVDKLVQNTHLKAENNWELIDWIEYDRFENIEYLAKGGFGTVFKAIWKDGVCYLENENGQFKRTGKTEVALKRLHNSQNITAEFLREVR